MRVDYADGDGKRTTRVIQPFAAACGTAATLICAWCELRNDVRHFRSGRVVAAGVLDDAFETPPGGGGAERLAERRDR